MLVSISTYADWLSILTFIFIFRCSRLHHVRQPHLPPDTSHQARKLKICSNLAVLPIGEATLLPSHECHDARLMERLAIVAQSPGSMKDWH